MCSHDGCGLASGVNHDVLVRCVENSFSSDNTRVASEASQAEYVGGKGTLTVCVCVCVCVSLQPLPHRVRAQDCLRFLPYLSSYCVQGGQVSVRCCGMCAYCSSLPPSPPPV